MPSRILKESICTSDTVDALSEAEENLFYRLLVQCDDYGCMDGRLAIIQSRCYPLRRAKLTDRELQARLDALVRVGLVQTYTVEGKPYLHIRTWDKHQQIRAKRRKFPEPPDDGDSLQSSDIRCNQVITDSLVIQSNPNPIWETVSPCEPANHLMFRALATACQVDEELERGKLGKISSRLVKAGYSPDQVSTCYGADGWWYEYDWRGKKGQAPTPEQVLSTIKHATGPPEGERGNGMHKLEA